MLPIPTSLVDKIQLHKLDVQESSLVCLRSSVALIMQDIIAATSEQASPNLNRTLDTLFFSYFVLIRSCMYNELPVSSSLLENYKNPAVICCE